MVSVNPTLVSIQDATLIEAEDLTIGLNKGGDWTKGDCDFEISHAVTINLLISGGSHPGDLGLLKLAGRLKSCVRVILSLHNAKILSICIRGVNTPIIATMIAILICGTVNQLLNREFIEWIDQCSCVLNVAANFHNRYC